MAKAIELEAEIVRANAGFHSDQAWRHIGKSGLNLTTRPFLPQNDRTSLVEANNMKRVLADIDADHGNLTGFMLRAVPCRIFGRSILNQEQSRRWYRPILG
jgi:hypothetical protein